MNLNEANKILNDNGYLMEDNVNNVQRWSSDHCNGAIMQLAKMSLNDTIEAIKKADLNKLAEKEIDKWSH